MDCGLVMLIVTVPELERGAWDNATWDDQPYKHDNDDVRYKPRCPVCHSRKWRYNSRYTQTDQVRNRMPFSFVNYRKGYF